MSSKKGGFIKGSLFLLLGLFLGENSIISSELEKGVIINLPAYTLTLKSDDKKIYTFPIGIGKGYFGRSQTPTGEGFIYEKRKNVIFRYDKDYPNFNIKKGDIIRWTNTFDENGNPMDYHMPYSKIRAFGTKIKKEDSDDYYNNFVIHSSTDEFTIGTPSSGGCIRVRMEDMSKLYNIISPEIKDGDLEEIILMDIIYKLIEFKQENVIFHANIYHKDIDYIEEFKKEAIKQGYNGEDFDYNKINKEFLGANREFNKIHKQILDILARDYPNNFTSPFLKEQLHKTYKISNFLKN